MKQKYESKSLNQILEDNSISLKKFLVLYCGINPESLNDIRFSHNDIKVIMPHIRRTSFKYLMQNINELYIGKIISVKDSYGLVLPYICPRINEISNPDITCNEEKEEIELSNDLKLYELRLLKKKLKEYKRYKEYRNATKLIRSKIDYKAKQYKKEKCRLKEREKENEY